MWLAELDLALTRGWSNNTESTYYGIRVDHRFYAYNSVEGHGLGEFLVYPGDGELLEAV